ncbi:MAG: DUF2442 domain-containing protein [Candidatus Dadabacteria bacterium]|nr:DUF2442 domain-containing protein [Candidatus Dadabacteria bacterium]
MKHPRIKSAKAADGYTLIVEFDNDRRKKYDIAPLLEREMFSPLRDLSLFKSVKVERGGYAVVWGDKADISEHEIWEKGVELEG